MSIGQAVRFKPEYSTTATETLVYMVIDTSDNGSRATVICLNPVTITFPETVSTSKLETIF